MKFSWDFISSIFTTYSSSRVKKQTLKILVPVISLILIISFTITVLFSHIAKSVFISSIGSAVKANLDLSKELYTDVQTAMIPIGLNLIMDSSILAYLSAQTQQNDIILAAIKTLDRAVSVNYHIHSIYLYNERLGYISTMAGYEGTTPASNPDLPEFIKTSKTPYKYYLRRTCFIKSNGIDTSIDSENTYSVVLPAFTKEGRTGILVINVTERKLKPIIDTSPSWGGQNLYIINQKDPQKPIMYSPYHFLFNTTALMDNRLTFITAQTALTGIIQAQNSTGKKWQCVWTDSAEMGWRFVYLIPEHILFREIYQLQQQFLSIALYVCLLGILCMIIIAYRLQRQLSFEIGICDYLRGTKDFTFTMHLPWKFHYLAAVKLPADTVGSEHILFSNKRKTATLLKIDSSGIYAMLSMYPLKLFKDNLEKMQAETVLYDTTISIEDWPIAWQQLHSELKKVHLCSEKYSLITFNSVQENFHNEYTTSFDIFTLDTFKNALCNSDEKTLLSEKNTIINTLRSLRNPDIFHALLPLIARIVTEELSEACDSNLPTGMNGWLDNLYKSETITELDTLLTTIINVAITHAKFVETNYYQQLISKIKLYIIDNITNKTLNSATIAEYLGFSLNYIRTLFKKRTGIPLNEYINSYRIELAKQMLIETDKTVYEICEEIGFGTYSYFCTYFKKTEGISPSAYHHKMNIQTK